MAQITDETDVASCSTCSEPDNDAGTNLKLCAKCRITKYCSRECQKTDWKVHKNICSRNAAARAENITASPTAASTSTSGPNASSGNAATTTKSLEKTIDRPFHKLETGTWLHNRSETDVYKLLIDTYRLRMEDNYKLEGEACADSIYGGATDARLAFRGFLRLVESRRRLLPSWWSKQTAEECVAFGSKNGEWSELNCAVEKSDIIEHYGDELMPMQLRMFGQLVYGRGPGGQDGTAMRRLQMQIESGALKVDPLFG